MDIFKYTNYRKYLEKYMDSLPQQGRGFRTKLAQHLGVKTSFISMLFAGTVNFSIEQAYALKSLLAWSDQELTYFLNLVQLERAGTKELRDYYSKEVERLRVEALRLKNQVVAGAIQSKEHEHRYFSSSDYAYVHILTTISTYQSKEALLKKSGLTPNRLEKVLNFLMEIGLVRYDKGRYQPGPSILHLSDDASIIASHHTNWRVQAIKACQSASETDLHYSSVISISEEDFFKIKAQILKELKGWRDVIRDSPSEDAYSLCFDLYKLK